MILSGNNRYFLKMTKQGVKLLAYCPGSRRSSPKQVAAAALWAAGRRCTVRMAGLALRVLASGHEGDGQEAGLAGDAEPRPQARWAVSLARALGLCTHTLHPTRRTDIFVVKILKTPFKVFGHWQCIS